MVHYPKIHICPLQCELNLDKVKGRVSPLFLINEIVSIISARIFIKSEHYVHTLIVYCSIVLQFSISSHPKVLEVWRHDLNIFFEGHIEICCNTSR